MSTEEQAKHGFSIAAQIRECQSLVPEATPLVFADEGVSGETLQRPALEELRQKVDLGEVSTVLCLDPDRLSRKLLHQLLLTEEWERRGVHLSFVNGDYSKTPEGNLFYALRGAISEFEKAKITERMCRGRREKARQGRVLRDFQIYGYDFEPVREQLLVNPEEAVIVRQIFAWFLAPPPEIRGISGIARALTSLKVPTKRGAKSWHRQVVRQILSNRTYLGEFYQNKWDASNSQIRLRPPEEWILIPCPPIVQVDVFAKAQLLLDTARRRHAGPESTFLLSGLVSCSLCGKPMRGKSSPVAPMYAEPSGAGCGLSISQTLLEDAIWEWCWKELVSSASAPLSEAQTSFQIRRELIRMLIKEIKILGQKEVTLITF